MAKNTPKLPDEVAKKLAEVGELIIDGRLVKADVEPPKEEEAE